MGLTDIAGEGVRGLADDNLGDRKVEEPSRCSLALGNLARLITEPLQVVPVIETVSKQR